MIARLLTLVRVLLGRRRLERELDEELRFHLEMEELENRRRGMPPQDARTVAHDVFGGYERIKEQCRDARGGRAVEMFAQDLRFAMRTLRARPGFSAAAVFTLGLGIGVNTAMFSVVNGVLIQPLPYAHGNRLVHIIQRAAQTQEEIGFSPIEVGDYRLQNSTFDTLVEYHSMAFTLLGGSEPQRVKAAVVSAEFFEVMGLQPLLGRTFRAGEDSDRAAPVLILSHAFWQRAFGGDPSVIGRRLEMNDREHTVIGVLPPAPLAYPNPDDVYMPISSCPFRSGASWRDTRDARSLSVFGRLRDGVGQQQALEDLRAITARLQQLHPTAYAVEKGIVVETLSLRDELTRDAAPTFRLLTATSAFVLLIACANVANLMLAALARRNRELALRTALGAGRARIVRQLLTESGLLALGGGVVGLALAAVSLDTLVDFAQRFTPRAQEITIDGTVLTFTFVLSIVTGLALGTLPALSREDLVVSLKDGSDATFRFAPRRARTLLIAAQLAVSFMLLMGAGLTLRSVARLQNVDPGFDPENVLTARLDLDWSKYRRERGILTFTDRLLQQVRQLPGVTHAAVANTFPLVPVDLHTEAFLIRGREQRSGVPPPVTYVRSASAGYFGALGVRLVSGRLYDEDDERDGRPVAVINESLARRYWGNGDPIGEQVSGSGGRQWATIIGVVSDVRHDGLDRAPAGEAYIPWTSNPWRDLRLMVRIKGAPESATGSLREIVRAIDPAQPITEIRTLMDFRGDSLASPRLTALLLAAFALLSLGIAATGLAAVVAFSVGQRTREFGIRMVVGAHPRQVLRMVITDSMALVVAGLALGIACALSFTRALSGLLFETNPLDPLTFLGVSAVLLVVAAVACLIPARRATLVHPMTVLRTN